MVFAVIGGDERQSRLAAQLEADGHSVRAFALDMAPLPAGIINSEITADALHGADCLILPLPASVKRGYLNAPMSSEAYCIGEVFGAIPPGRLVCVGMPDAYTLELAERSGAALRDYYACEELLAANAVATAEGTIGVLLRETSSTLWRSRILIVGWGRLGKALAPRLRALGAEVSVSARNSGDMAWIAANCFRALDTRSLEGHLSCFDIVVNTVPSLVVTFPRLGELPRRALVVDLASKPGGVDFEAAKKLGIRTIHALSLPGMWAPETAAAAIKSAVYRILGEEH